jgi:hypothetical protein
MSHATFNIGDLTAAIGDNEAEGDHRSGYNGVWSLTHRTGTRSLFVPAYAGLNHEHIFNGDAEADAKIFFEPRNAPMTFRKVSDSEAELHQPPTPTFHLESWTNFMLVEPHYLDMTYRCVAHQHVFHRGYIGLFWANYINAPADKSMYFLGGLEKEASGWTQLCTPRHNDESTVYHRDDKFDLTFEKSSKETLYRNLSPLRFDQPFFYGLFDEHVWIVMFDQMAGIRFTHSPSGGGGNAQRQTTNPAWDFQFIIPNYDVTKPYSFKARTIFRPRCSREDILQEYRKWKKG